jgi:hypothetical protein
MEEDTQKYKTGVENAMLRSHDSIKSLGIATGKEETSETENLDDVSGKNMDSSDQQWRMMYCGGSAKVVEVLNGVSAKHDVPLSLEFFEW